MPNYYPVAQWHRDRMEETLQWMTCLEVEERKLVWKLAARVRLDNQ